MLDKITQNKQLMHFIETTQKKMVASEIGNSSVVVAYYLLLSLFPLLIAIGNILPYLNIDPDDVMPYIAEVIPQAVFDDLQAAIKSLLTQRSGGVLSLSALAAIWSASQSINALQNAMNKIFGVKQRTNYLIVRALSVVVMILLLVAIFGVVLIFILGQSILEFLQPMLHISVDFIETFATLKWPLTFFALLVIMGMIYALVPNAKLSFQSIFPGAIFATVGWLLLSQVFGLYIKYFSSRVAGYQIIGSFIVLMLWLNLAATIVILGGIVNAVVENYLSEAKKQSKNALLEEIKRTIQAKFTP